MIPCHDLFQCQIESGIKAVVDKKFHDPSSITRKSLFCKPDAEKYLFFSSAATAGNAIKGAFSAVAAN